MSQITIRPSVSREDLVEMIEMSGIAQLEAHLASQPSETTAELYGLCGYVFCQVSNDPGVWRWSSMGTWTDGTEDLEEAQVELEKAILESMGG